MSLSASWVNLTLRLYFVLEYIKLSRKKLDWMETDLRISFALSFASSSFLGRPAGRKSVAKRLGKLPGFPAGRLSALSTGADLHHQSLPPFSRPSRRRSGQPESGWIWWGGRWGEWGERNCSSRSSSSRQVTRSLFSDFQLDSSPSSPSSSPSPPSPPSVHCPAHLELSGHQQLELLVEITGADARPSHRLHGHVRDEWNCLCNWRVPSSGQLQTRRRRRRRQGVKADRQNVPLLRHRGWRTGSKGNGKWD